MIDELREEEIVNKVGGRFKLSTLIQKRLVALNAGGRPLVDIDSDDKMQIVIEETEAEMNFFKEHHQEYGYTFFIMQAI